MDVNNLDISSASENSARFGRLRYLGLGVSIFIAGAIVGVSAVLLIQESKLPSRTNPPQPHSTSLSQIKQSYEEKRLMKPSIVPQIPVTTVPRPSSSIIPISIGDIGNVDNTWKSYNKSRMGFSLKLPPTWGLIELTENLVFRIGPIENNTVQEVIFGYALARPGERLSPEELQKTGGQLFENQSFQIGGYNALRFRLASDSGSPTGYLDEVQINMPSGRQTIFYVFDPGYEKALTTIISTFEHINTVE